MPTEVDCNSMQVIFALDANKELRLMRIAPIHFFICAILFTQHTQPVLKQDFSFMLYDNEVKKLHQSNDTLYELKCYVDHACQPKPGHHFRVLSTLKIHGYLILKTEQLDTLQLTPDPYPESRYTVFIFKNMDDKQLGYMHNVSGLTKARLDSFSVDVEKLDDQFFFTYYSEAYLNKLKTLKKVTSKPQALLLLEKMKDWKYRTMVEQYTKTVTNDMYGAGLTSELLTKACIENGFNPFGAGVEIERLLKIARQ